MMPVSEGCFAIFFGGQLDGVVPFVVIPFGDFSVPEHVAFQAFSNVSFQYGADDDGFLKFRKVLFGFALGYIQRFKF